MAEVYNFKDYQKKKKKRSFQDERTTVAIYKSVVHYVHMYIEPQYEEPFEHLTTNICVPELYKYNKGKFLETFASLLAYWNIEPHPESDIPRGEEFNYFPTIGHLCVYIEKRVKGL
ncbi:hypothetical protein [Halobacillus sp. KGW1]|uniref:hypothetical protein n=1 Tax=Halobacillus sp. KGW1 TaxID=1793726 RepID=UPI000781E936|nr:hypothetical protein [Halobacillus sp. KGW1]